MVGVDCAMRLIGLIDMTCAFLSEQTLCGHGLTAGPGPPHARLAGRACHAACGRAIARTLVAVLAFPVAAASALRPAWAPQPGSAAAIRWRPDCRSSWIRARPAQMQDRS